MQLRQKPDSRNKIRNPVGSIDDLFNRVLELAVFKQHSLEKAALQLQDLDTGIGHLSQVVEEIDNVLSLQEDEMASQQLRQHIELCQV